MDNRKHPTRMLTAIITASVLVMVLLLIPAAAVAATEQPNGPTVGTETKGGPVGILERIDEPDFACGARCGVDLCVSDSMTSSFHWCALYAMGDGCDGGYDPYICGGESGF